MAPTLQFVEATPAHAEALAPLLRAEDLAEVAASGHGTGLDALLGSLAASDGAWAAIIGDEVAAMFGVVPIHKTLLGGERLGIAWLLTGRAIARSPRLLLRYSRLVLATLLLDWDGLCNYVDARYAGAVRWAKWLGLNVGKPVPFGPDGLPFHPVGIRRQPWARVQ